MRPILPGPVASDESSPVRGGRAAAARVLARLPAAGAAAGRYDISVTGAAR